MKNDWKQKVSSHWKCMANFLVSLTLLSSRYSLFWLIAHIYRCVSVCTLVSFSCNFVHLLPLRPPLPLCVSLFLHIIIILQTITTRNEMRGPSHKKTKTKLYKLRTAQNDSYECICVCVCMCTHLHLPIYAFVFLSIKKKFNYGTTVYNIDVWLLHLTHNTIYYKSVIVCSFKHISCALCVCYCKIELCDICACMYRVFVIIWSGKIR